MMRKPVAFTLVALATIALSGCPQKEETTEAPADEAKKKKKKKKDTEATASATATAAAAPAKTDYGPTVAIGAGSMRAGSRCYDVPRIRPNELEHKEISLGEFEIDTYPYPNEPGKPAMLNVTYDKAAELCKERGKRLCTELEWERACKGPKSTTYMWGNGYKNKVCDGQLDHMIGQRPECKSEFGVMDMMGVAIEWTSNDWERGTPTGDKVVHGARAEKVSWLSARCTHSRKRNPDKKYDNVGFRCCSGAANAAKVVLPQKKRTPVEEDPDTETAFEMTLMKAMPKDHRAITGIELSFDKVYRWHPVENEEMIIARWKGTPKDRDPFYEIAVFKVCGRIAWRAARMRGPVAATGKPKVGINARKVSFDVKTGGKGGSVGLAYWHGTVKLKQPDWVKQGNQLKVKAKMKAKAIPKAAASKKSVIKR